MNKGSTSKTHGGRTLFGFLLHLLALQILDKTSRMKLSIRLEICGEFISLIINAFIDFSPDSFDCQLLLGYPSRGPPKGKNKNDWGKVSNQRGCILKFLLDAANNLWRKRWMMKRKKLAETLPVRAFVQTGWVV